MCDIRYSLGLCSTFCLAVVKSGGVGECRLPRLGPVLGIWFFTLIFEQLVMRERQVLIALHTKNRQIFRRGIKLFDAPSFYTFGVFDVGIIRSLVLYQS